MARGRGGNVIVENWTESGNAVVLTGGSQEIALIAVGLGMPLDDVTGLGPNTAALGLWGSKLRAYLRSNAGDTLGGGWSSPHSAEAQAPPIADRQPADTRIFN